METQTISLVFFTRKNIRTQQVAKQVLELFFTLGEVNLLQSCLIVVENGK